MAKKMEIEMTSMKLSESYEVSFTRKPSRPNNDRLELFKIRAWADDADTNYVETQWIDPHPLFDQTIKFHNLTSPSTLRVRLEKKDNPAATKMFGMGSVSLDQLVGNGSVHFPSKADKEIEQEMTILDGEEQNTDFTFKVLIKQFKAEERKRFEALKPHESSPSPPIIQTTPPVSSNSTPLIKPLNCSKSALIFMINTNQYSLYRTPTVRYNAYESTKANHIWEPGGLLCRVFKTDGCGQIMEEQALSMTSIS
ncbi:unnamed protein product [Arabis nemorensis]|uniref:Uncharacterized protein n=1 Tax=Arabis nemorensis TaxID=586526 RepID=A0A565B5Z5_9BRAS|nr:unnamed protein product [Arabis nemorensis]